MIFAHQELESEFDTENGCYNTLVVEQQDMFTRLLTDFYEQGRGFPGKSMIYSSQNTALPFSKSVCVLGSFVPLDLNRKPLLNKIIAAMEKNALSAENYSRTQRVLTDVEMLFEDIRIDLPCDMAFENLSVSALLKAASPVLSDESTSLAERVLELMELICTYEGERLFITVCMRDYVGDEEMQHFAESAISHGYGILALETHERTLLKNECRVIIDKDLCEIA